MDQLRATFIAGPSAGFNAQDVFTNRVSEIEAFQHALEAFDRQRQAASYPLSLDMTQPRQNVLVYYGMGGVGKTALSRQLERRFLQDTDRHKPPPAAVRYDLGESGDFDVETLLLKVRFGLGSVRPRWPAFDMAFGQYWAATHPGEALPEYVMRSSALGQTAERIDAAEQMQNVLSQVLSEVGMAWTPTRVAVRLASLTHSHLRRSVTYRRLLESCPFFEPIVTSMDHRTSLTYMASLLAWEIDVHARSHPVNLAVFLDTVESIGGRPTREMERDLQRSIHLMPNVLWIVTTRNRLDWAELPSPSELDYVGVERWPLLHFSNKTDEPRQHLVGGLSPADCEAYLAHALTDADGNAALGESLRRTIIDGSGGLPLYLDLSVTQFLELSAKGGPIDEDSFGGSLSSIVTRIMRDLDHDQRNVLRGVSLLDTFDFELARVVSGAADATVARFLDCSLVVKNQEGTWPFSLHSELQKALQETDHQLRDAWSPREWRAASERLIEHLGHIARTAQGTRDVNKVAGCFTQCMRTSMRFDQQPEWLVDAAQFLADAGAWNVLQVRPPSDDSLGAGTMALADGLRAISLRRTGSLPESIILFDRALAAPELQDHARSLLRLHRAHSVRNSGAYEDAERDYQAVATESGTAGLRARLQLADLQLLRGEFQAALHSLSRVAASDPDARGEALRLEGHVHRANGNLDAAERLYQEALLLGRNEGSRALEGKALTNLAETLCWKQPEAGLRYAEESIDLNLSVGNQLEVLKAQVAKGIATADPAASRDALGKASALADTSNYRAGRIFVCGAEAFMQAKTADPQILDTLRRTVELADSLGVYQYWSVIVAWWAETFSIPIGAELDRSSRVQWMDASLARSRWATLVTT